MNLKEFLDFIFGRGGQELVSPIPEGMVPQFNVPQAQAAEPVPQNQPPAPFMFNATPYGEPIEQPNPEIAALLQKYFPQDATRAAVVANTESRYNPEAVGKNIDKETGAVKSVDTGLFQINSDTFKDFMNRKKHVLDDYGINDYSQMKNPIFNAAMAKIIQDEQGWNAWYGPRNYGYNLKNK